ncbi:MAG: methylmalonyl-CoA mutase family protein, partial [Psychrobacillus sp.]
MTINDMKQTKFNEASFTEWEQAAVKSLKGKSLESLETKTLEDIILKPLYTLADLENIPDEQTKTVRESKESASWKVAQQSVGLTSEEILSDLNESLSKGNNVINYKVKIDHKWNDSQLQELKELFQHYEVLLDVKNDPSFLKHFDYLNGSIIGAEEEFKGARTLHLDGSKLHKAGGDAISELASVLVQADTFVHLHGIEKVEENAFVQFSVDTNFFMEIAKLRAFRILWKAFGEAFGKENAKAIPVYA